ncbi:hypothetical protein [Syntrophus aciditrophicus]|uniref:Hypothetical cytosolic protein n=1 Tax=Syntrophus aciditrophicus (strain SB) TaxID=56780 RepID=Q2LT87_SYNAS|nr:hypothetical protein [Syntrophus aciditrophicus]ABC77298.1 hypothetical cytosolic protein [Syntrophus aciditrophicus SB]OPY17848.1 MAG: hypothetical protein A4E74_01035 [Syntrophus sp. PtaB.Bin075]
MELNLKEEEKSYVKITYSSDHFIVNIGKKNSISREYYSVRDMMKEFQENDIDSADFDDEAHRRFKKEINDNPYY